MILDELSKLMKDPRIVKSGEVLSVDNGRLRVKTRLGVQELSAIGSTNFRAGDEVKIQAGIVVGKLRPARLAKKFVV